MSGEHPTRKFFLDLGCFLILQVPYVYMLFLGAEPYKTGFFCDDKSLMYPVTEQSISLGTMALICIGATYVVMIVTNIILYNTDSYRTEFTREYSLCCCSIHPCLWVSFKDIATFMVGASLLEDGCEATKIFVGRLRPHFFAVCKPDFSSLNCSQFVPIENFTCTNELDKGGLYNAMTSFPSSHASFSGFCMLYIVFFLQAKMTWRESSFLKITIQSGALAFSLYCSVTRISDYVHHPSDVVGGLVMGAAIAVVMVFWVSDMFQHGGASLTPFRTMPPSTADFQKDFNYGSTVDSRETMFGNRQ